MKPSFHISENERGGLVVSIELAATSEFDTALFRRLMPMKQGGVNVQRESMVILFYEKGGLDGQAPDDNRPA